MEIGETQVAKYQATKSWWFIMGHLKPVCSMSICVCLQALIVAIKVLG